MTRYKYEYLEITPTLYSLLKENDIFVRFTSLQFFQEIDDQKKLKDYFVVFCILYLFISFYLDLFFLLSLLRLSIFHPFFYNLSFLFLSSFLYVSILTTKIKPPGVDMKLIERVINRLKILNFWSYTVDNFSMGFLRPKYQ